MPRISDGDREARRDRILDAAETCLRRNGRAAFTTRALVAEAGISTGAVYHHFAGLDEIVDAVAERRMVAGIGAAAAAAPAGEDPLAWAVRALVGAPPFAPERGSAQAVSAVMEATLAEVLVAARAAGAIRADLDDEALVELLEVVWSGLDDRVATGTLRTSLDRLTTLLVRLVDTGLRHPANG